MLLSRGAPIGATFLAKSIEHAAPRLRRGKFYNRVTRLKHTATPAEPIVLIGKPELINRQPSPLALDEG
jgi:hypothetical protein